MAKERESNPTMPELAPSNLEVVKQMIQNGIDKGIGGQGTTDEACHDFLVAERYCNEQMIVSSWKRMRQKQNEQEQKQGGGDAIIHDDDRDGDVSSSTNSKDGHEHEHEDVVRNDGVDDDEEIVDASMLFESSMLLLHAWEGLTTLWIHMEQYSKARPKLVTALELCELMEDSMAMLCFRSNEYDTTTSNGADSNRNNNIKNDPQIGDEEDSMKELLMARADLYCSFSVVDYYIQKVPSQTWNQKGIQLLQQYHNLFGKSERSSLVFGTILSYQGSDTNDLECHYNAISMLKQLAEQRQDQLKYQRRLAYAYRMISYTLRRRRELLIPKDDDEFNCTFVKKKESNDDKDNSKGDDDGVTATTTDAEHSTAEEILLELPTELYAVDRAIAIAKELLEKDPKSPLFLRELSYAYEAKIDQVKSIPTRRRTSGELYKSLQSCIDARSKLNDKWPRQPWNLNSLASSLLELASLDRDGIATDDIDDEEAVSLALVDRAISCAELAVESAEVLEQEHIQQQVKSGESPSSTTSTMLRYLLTWTETLRIKAKKLSRIAATTTTTTTTTTTSTATTTNASTTTTTTTPTTATAATPPADDETRTTNTVQNDGESDNGGNDDDDDSNSSSSSSESSNDRREANTNDNNSVSGSSSDDSSSDSSSSNVSRTSSVAAVSPVASANNNVDEDGENGETSNVIPPTTTTTTAVVEETATTTPTAPIDDDDDNDDDNNTESNNNAVVVDNGTVTTESPLDRAIQSFQLYQDIFTNRVLKRIMEEKAEKEDDKEKDMPVSTTSTNNNVKGAKGDNIGNSSNDNDQNFDAKQEEGIKEKIVNNENSKEGDDKQQKTSSPSSSAYQNKDPYVCDLVGTLLEARVCAIRANRPDVAIQFTKQAIEAGKQLKQRRHVHIQADAINALGKLLLDVAEKEEEDAESKEEEEEDDGDIGQARTEAGVDNAEDSENGNGQEETIEDGTNHETRQTTTLTTPPPPSTTTTKPTSRTTGRKIDDKLGKYRQVIEVYCDALELLGSWYQKFPWHVHVCSSYAESHLGMAEVYQVLAERERKKIRRKQKQQQQNNNSNIHNTNSNEEHCYRYAMSEAYHRRTYLWIRIKQYGSIKPNEGMEYSHYNTQLLGNHSGNHHHVESYNRYFCHRDDDDDDDIDDDIDADTDSNVNINRAQDDNDNNTIMEKDLSGGNTDRDTSSTASDGTAAPAAALDDDDAGTQVTVPLRSSVVPALALKLRRHQTNSSIDNPWVRRLVVAKELQSLRDRCQVEESRLFKSFHVECYFEERAEYLSCSVYLTTAIPGEDPLENQAMVLKEDYGGELPTDVREAIRKLRDLALKNDVSFPDLAVYAVMDSSSSNSSDDSGSEQDEDDDDDDED